MANRVRPMPIEDSDLMLKILAQRGHALVASPDLVEKAGVIRVPADLSSYPASTWDRRVKSTSGSWKALTASRPPSTIGRDWSATT